MNCNCGSDKRYQDCCEPLHLGKESANTAEQLMRSRYTAYTLCLVDYLLDTTLPAERKHYDRADMLKWASGSKWMGLDIIKATEHTVEFKAHFLDGIFTPMVHHEKSTFKQLNGKWYYAKGKSA